VPLNFYRDSVYSDLLNKPEYKDVREIWMPAIKEFIVMPEATFRATIFDCIDELDDDAAKGLIFILLLLLRQSVGVAGDGN
jgi:hypothetical protein